MAKISGWRLSNRVAYKTKRVYNFSNDILDGTEPPKKKSRKIERNNWTGKLLQRIYTLRVNEIRECGEKNEDETEHYSLTLALKVKCVPFSTFLCQLRLLKIIPVRTSFTIEKNRQWNLLFFSWCKSKQAIVLFSGRNINNYPFFEYSLNRLCLLII